MAQLRLEDIKYLARLSNLLISEEEAKKYPEQLSESLEYIENLNELDVSGVDDSAYVSDLRNVMQEDVVDKEATLSGEEALKNATNKKGDYFVVKRIL